MFADAPLTAFKPSCARVASLMLQVYASTNQQWRFLSFVVLEAYRLKVFRPINS